MDDRHDKLVLATGLVVSVLLHIPMLLAIPMLTDHAGAALSADQPSRMASRDDPGDTGKPPVVRPIEPEQKQLDREEQAPSREQPPPQSKEETHPELYRPGADHGEELQLAWIDYDAFEKLIAEQRMSHEQAALQKSAEATDDAPLQVSATDPGAVVKVDQMAVASAAGVDRQPRPGQSASLQMMANQAAAQGAPDDEGDAPVGQHSAAAMEEPATNLEEPSRVESRASAGIAELPQTPSASPPAAESPGVDPVAAEAEAPSEQPPAKQERGESIDDARGVPTRQKEVTTNMPLGDEAVDQARGIAGRIDPQGDSASQEAAAPPQPMAGVMEEAGFEPAQSSENLAPTRQIDAEGLPDSQADPTLQAEARAPNPAETGKPADQLPAEADRINDDGTPVTQDRAETTVPDPEGEPSRQNVLAERGADETSQESQADDPSSSSQPQPDEKHDAPSTAEALRLAMAEVAMPSDEIAARKGRTDGDAKSQEESGESAQQAGGATVTAVPTATPRDDREADIAGRDKQPDVVKPGGVRVINGVRTLTYAPRFSVVSLSSALPNNPLVEITFNKDGKAIDAHILETTRYPDIDAVILASLYRWKQEGENLRKRDGPATIQLRMVLVGRD